MDEREIEEQKNVPFWNEPPPRTAGRLRVVPLFSLAFRWRMGEDFERKKEDGEDGNWNRGGWEMTWRGGKRTKRTEEDGDDFEEGGKRDSDQDETRTLRWEENGTQRENENKESEEEEKDLEKDENGTLRMEKKDIMNHVIL